MVKKSFVVPVIFFYLESAANKRYREGHLNGQISKNQRHHFKVEASNYLSLVYFVPRTFP